MRKGNFLVLILMLVMFMFVGNVKAFPETYTGQESIKKGTQVCTVHMTTSGTTASFPCETTETQPIDYPYFTIKQATIGGKTVRAVCLSGMTYDRPAVNQTCTLDKNWDANQSAAVGYIIKTIESGSGDEFQKTYLEENIVQHYLGVLVVGNTEEKRRANNFITFYTKNKIPGTNMTLPQIVEAAKNSNKISITANDAKTVNLKFELKEDGYYYSNPVTISSSEAYELGAVDNKKFEVVKNGNTYTFKIKETDVSLGSKESFTSKTTISKKYYVAGKYICSGKPESNPNKGYPYDGYQNMTYVETEEKTVSDTITITGLIGTPNTLTVTKLSDADKKPLAGAKLEILDSEKKSISCTFADGKTVDKCEWVSEKDPKVIVGLSAGNYYLQEVEAPKGFELNKEPVEFEVKNENKSVEMVNVLKVEVPDTLSPMSALLIAIAMFDIALGIGIITYVKKNKVTE